MADHDPCPSRVLLVQAEREIERLQAELERLNAPHDMDILESQQAEIERLREALQSVVDDKEGDLDFVKWQARQALEAKSG